MCNEAGITLIVVPFWWNKTIESLAQTLRIKRPDLPLSLSLLRGEAISAEMPKQQHQQGMSRFGLLSCNSEILSTYFP